MDKLPISLHDIIGVKDSSSNIAKLANVAPQQSIDSTACSKGGSGTRPPSFSGG